MATFPTKARIIPSKYSQHRDVLVRMGLPKSEFRAIDERNGNIVVDPKDLTLRLDVPFMLRSDIVELLDES